jgi:hypothetical protein
VAFYPFLDSFATRLYIKKAPEIDFRTLFYKIMGVLSGFALCTTVDNLGKCFASLEFCLVGSCNLDNSASARIAAFGGFTMNNGKGAETDEADFFAFGEGFGDACDDGIEAFTGLCFGDIALICHFGNEFVLVHGVTPFVALVEEIRKKDRRKLAETLDFVGSLTSDTLKSSTEHQSCKQQK